MLSQQQHPSLPVFSVLYMCMQSAHATGEPTKQTEVSDTQDCGK